MQVGDNELSPIPRREDELKHLEQLQGSRQRLFLFFAVLFLLVIPFAPGREAGLMAGFGALFFLGGFVKQKLSVSGMREGALSLLLATEPRRSKVKVVRLGKRGLALRFDDAQIREIRWNAAAYRLGDEQRDVLIYEDSQSGNPWTVVVSDNGMSVFKLYPAQDLQPDLLSKQQP